jgi:hypothetical protein
MEYSEEIKKELLRERSSCGNAEFEIAYGRALEANNGKRPTSKQIVDALDAWRAPFANETGIASVLKSKEQWQEIYNASEKAARAELLQSSDELRTLNEPEARALEAQRQAAAQEQKLQGFWAEFQGLPSKANAYNERLSAIDAQRNAGSSRRAHDRSEDSLTK